MLLLEGKIQHSYNLHILRALEETCSHAKPQDTTQSSISQLLLTTSLKNISGTKYDSNVSLAIAARVCTSEKGL